MCAKFQDKICNSIKKIQFCHFYVIENSRKILQQAGKKRDSQPSQQNKQNFSKALKSLKKTYLSEQTKYLQQKIDEIENSVANQKSSNAWKVINENSGRRSTNSAKLKASNQEERVKLWKKHFQDLLGKPPQTDEQTEIVNIVADELKIRNGPFQMDELSIAINSIKSGKACGLDGIPAEVWKLKDFHHIAGLLQQCLSTGHDNSMDRRMPIAISQKR